jgi:(p)ppGpp synthase/HD superfamily hydrolase
MTKSFPTPPRPSGRGGVPLPQWILDEADEQGGDPNVVHPLHMLGKTLSPDRFVDYSGAWVYAALCHDGQRDKSGADYFDSHVTAVTMRTAMLAPLHVRDDAVIAALLHDTVEDRTRGQEEAAEMLDGIENFWGKEIRDVVDALSQRKTGRWIKRGDDEWPELERRRDFINRVVRLPIATVVKLADNLVNSDPAGLALIEDVATRERLMDKYRPERKRLRREFRKHFGNAPGIVLRRPTHENEMGDRR